MTDRDIGSDRVQITKDGSHTLYCDMLGETYHSAFGAIQESRHIFIEAGLNKQLAGNMSKINILEVGTGTGLNVLLTLIQLENSDFSVNYDGFEPFPISNKEANVLNYPELLNADVEKFNLIHSAVNKPVILNENFVFKNYCKRIEDAELPDNYYNVIYFDAFSPDAQGELWNTAVFRKLYKSMTSGGVLTTYSCKGMVKRALIEVGFGIEKLPGPPGKREFLRAVKP